MDQAEAREIADRLWLGDQRGAVIAAARVSGALSAMWDVSIEFEEREVAALLRAAVAVEWLARGSGTAPLPADDVADSRPPQSA